MLCATNQVNAQDAPLHSHPSSPSSTATASTLSPHIMLIHDPYDPRINDEYEALVRKWTDHLLTKSRYSPIDNSMSSTTPSSPHHSTKSDKTVDLLLEEQWIDAQRMLSCAQAWNIRDSLSIEEAVRTMNILGLRMMQRSLTTKHELNVQRSTKTDEPMIDMPSFDLQSKTLFDEAINIPRFSLALSLDEDEEHEMHAPLLRRYQQSSDDNNSDSITHQHPITSNNNVQAATTCSTTSTLSTPARRPFRLMQSPSAPNFSESALLMERENCANKFAPANNYYRYYPTSWRPLPEQGDEDDENVKDNNGHISISSSSTTSSSSTSSSQDHEGYAWKSWFNHSHHQSHQHKQHVCTFCWNPIAKKSLSTGDADDAAAARLLSSSNSSSFESTACGPAALDQAQVWTPNSYHSACSPDRALLDHIHNKYGSSNDESSSVEEDVFETPTTSSFGFQTDTILRSESSISAFRPISKNLAPRCSPPPPPPAANGNDIRWRYQRREISSSIQADPQQRPAIPKSQSFPSKVASLASSSSHKIPDVPIIKASTTKSSASATTVPTTIMGKSADKSSSSKERNFVMRSIVSKKASLSKLFSGSKK
ncbi:hypothetical protein K492DRAFT_197769 [Lichtheimia hyalospora FSU 10163]|nr:hypothetical protein K492DRAFT_197769 [Lichtheimia hyalospora FSU 10163]